MDDLDRAVDTWPPAFALRKYQRDMRTVALRTTGRLNPRAYR